MNVINRVIVVAAALVALAGAVITTLVAIEVSQPDILFSGWFESQFQDVADSSGGDAAAIVAASIAIALGMIVLLFFELVPLNKAVRFLLGSTEHGIATIDKDSVRELAEKTAFTCHNVRDAECIVAKRTQDSMVIYCRASLDLGANIPEVIAELQGNIKNSVEQLTGLTVLQVNVKSKYEPGRTKRMALR